MVSAIGSRHVETEEELGVADRAATHALGDEGGVARYEVGHLDRNGLHLHEARPGAFEVLDLAVDGDRLLGNLSDRADAGPGVPARDAADMSGNRNPLPGHRLDDAPAAGKLGRSGTGLDRVEPLPDRARLVMDNALVMAGLDEDARCRSPDVRQLRIASPLNISIPASQAAAASSALSTCIMMIWRLPLHARRAATV